MTIPECSVVEEFGFPNLRKEILSSKNSPEIRSKTVAAYLSGEGFFDNIFNTKGAIPNSRLWFERRKNSVIEFFNPEDYNKQLLIYPDQSKDIQLAFGFKLSSELSYLAARIAASAHILEYEDNWDGLGSIKYALNTWIKAIEYLIKSATTVYENFGIKIDAPKILPGPEGSIDLYWKRSHYNLLINIPTADGQKAYCYGEDKEGNGVECEFDPKSSDLGAILCLLSLQMNQALK